MRSAAALRGFGSALSRRRLLPPPSCVGIADIHYRWPAAADAHDVLTSNAFAGSNRWFSSSPQSDDKEEESSTKAEEVIGETDPDTATGVNRTIRMHPDGFSRQILPGNYAMKVNAKTQTERKLLAERVFGYFWMFKDLELTQEKPLLGNEGCIDEIIAERFPSLGGKNDSRGTLPVTLTDEVVSLPDFVYRNNRAMDPTAQCTLVTLCYRDFGNQMLPAWIRPFKEALCHPASPRRNRVEVVQISIQEGLALRLLGRFMKSSFRKAVPEEDYERTLLYFGTDQNFKDVLRCHNTCAGYLFLLDGIGRVRWAGSGRPTDEEMDNLIGAARELTPVSTSSASKTKKQQRPNRR